jgi:hypothetical protein
MLCILQECCKKDKRSALKRRNRDRLRRYSGASTAPHHKETTMNANLPTAVTSAAATLAAGDGENPGNMAGRLWLWILGLSQQPQRGRLVHWFIA